MTASIVRTRTATELRDRFGCRIDYVPHSLADRDPEGYEVDMLALWGRCRDLNSPRRALPCYMLPRISGAEAHRRNAKRLFSSSSAADVARGLAVDAACAGALFVMVVWAAFGRYA